MRTVLHGGLEAIDGDELLRAVLAGMLAVVAASVVGTWVLLRGLTFLGDALAHGVIPGAALGLLWGFDPAIGALVSVALMVGGVGLVSSRSPVRDDAAIGLLFVGMLSLGLVLISRRPTFSTDVEELLIGDITHVTWGDIVVQVVAGVVVLVGSVAGYRSFLAMSFNEAKAGSLGLRPRAAHLALLALVAIAVVSSFQAVGTLLVFGLLVGPPATAALLVRRVWLCMVVGVALGWGAVGLGLFLSHVHDTAAGATMAGVSVATFFAVLAAKELTARRHRNSVALPGP